MPAAGDISGKKSRLVTGLSLHWGFGYALSRYKVSPRVILACELMCWWLPVRLQRAYARTRASVTGNYVA